MLLVSEQSIPTRIPERIGLGAVKLPPGTGLFKRIELLHSLTEASHSVHDGHGAISHRVELVEATRLKARRHEQHVAGCRDAV